MEEKQSWWQTEKSSIKIITIYVLSTAFLAGIVRSCLEVYDPQNKKKDEITLEQKCTESEKTENVYQEVQKENVDYKETKKGYNPYTN